MPLYYQLSRRKARHRTATSLLALRKQLREEIPRRTVTDTLLLATWNIRDFDSNKFGHGPRLEESLYYMAEIISSFDLVAIQEVSQDLRALKRLKYILGGNWDYLATDVAAGQPGNGERMVFIYDTNKVWFRHIAGELVLPNHSLIQGKHQFARTPFIVAFQSGWFKFMLCTVHIYYGADYGVKLEHRVAEIDAVAELLCKRAQKDEENSYILLGDFNIHSPQHHTMDALRCHGFIVPPQLANCPTTLKGDRYYDQIAFREQTDPTQCNPVRYGEAGGCFNLYKSVFQDGECDKYYEVVAQDKNRSTLKWEQDEKEQPRDSAGRLDYYTNYWRTYQMSDHFPLWIELQIDFSERYLEELAVPD